MTDLPTAFRTAHEAIGDELIPHPYTFRSLTRCLEPLRITSESPINALIVHAILWLTKHANDVLVTDIAVGIRIDENGKWDDSEEHTNDPATILTALLALATRVKQGEANAKA